MLEIDLEVATIVMLYLSKQCLLLTINIYPKNIYHLIMLLISLLHFK